MNLLIDTTKAHIGEQIEKELCARGADRNGLERIDTTGLHISHCIGCNYCWLKTPGICAIRDDYEPILKKMSKADQVWLITDTSFGFVSHQTKNIMDRVMPIITMYLHFKDKEMRHVMRYDHQPDLGIIYTGEGDEDYLNRWCGRTALNFGSRSLGAFRAEEREGAILCML